MANSLAPPRRRAVGLFLAEDVAGLGKQGEIVSVKPGFARNYLLPHGLATVATEHNKKRVEKHRQKLEELVRDERIKGISRITDLTDRTLPAWQVRLHIVIKRDADKEVVLNQLFQSPPLQAPFTFLFLALVGNRPHLLARH